jgi:hypothetical protein
MTAFGRKLPLKIDQISSSERPLWRKADIQGPARKADNLDSE